MKKTLFILILVFILVISGCVKKEIVGKKPVDYETAYYKNLANQCESDDYCCLDSVKRMASTNSTLAPGNTLAESGCPENTVPNMLKCPTSYRWCETIESEEIKCQKAGGTWQIFQDTCVDSCLSARNPNKVECGEMITPGCECGANKCWNGKECEII